MEQTLVLMTGPAGCGKTTIAGEIVKGRTNAVHISRDLIRFSMLSESDGYFDKEDDVFAEFVRQAQEAIDQGKTCIVLDATHLTHGARDNILLKLKNTKNIDLVVVHFPISLEQILAQNAKRTGQARVPDDVIKNMYKRYSIPSKKESEQRKKQFKSVRLEIVT